MTSQKKINITFLDEEAARTIGWPLQYAARALGVWPDKGDESLHRHFVHWIDRSKYDLSTVWEKGKRTWRLFQSGFSIAEQIDNAVSLLTEPLSYSDNDITIGFDSILNRVSFRNGNQNDEDFRRTLYHNMSSSLLPELNDHNYWTKFLTDDINGIATHPPAIPSAHSKVFKAEFDADAEIS